MSDNFFTYIILTQNNKLYCGYTNNLEERFKKHVQGKASKYTRANKPLRMVYFKGFETKNEAMKEECRIKTLSRKQKELVIKEFDATQLPESTQRHSF